MASQITGHSIVYSTIRQAQIKENLTALRHQSPLDSPHKGPVKRKTLSFGDVIVNEMFHLSARTAGLS